MSRSSTPSRSYGEIIGTIFSTGADGNKVGGSASELNGTPRNQFIKGKDDSAEEAKRIFRERRHHPPLRRSAIRSATPERRQYASPGRSRFVAGSSSRNATPERRSFRLRGSSPIRPQGNNGSIPPTPNDRFGNENSSRGLSESPARERGNGESNSSNRRARFQYRELESEQSIRRFSKSPARRKEYETAAARALNLQSGISSSAARANCTSPEKRRSNDGSNHGSEDQNQDLLKYPASVVANKDKEISSLRKELKEIQDHLNQVIVSQEMVSKRVEKKQRAMESSSAALEQIQKTARIQNEQIVFYEACLRKKDLEIEQLKHELQQSKRAQTKLELDLEVHDLKFSICDDYHRLTDKRRLDSKNEDEDDNEEELARRDLEKARLNNQDTEYLSILSKLDRLERVFEKSKSEITEQCSSLNEEYKCALKTINLLESRAKGDSDHQRRFDKKTQDDEVSDAAGSVSSTFATVPGTDLISMYGDSQSLPVGSSVEELLEKRVQILESDAMKSSLQLEGLREELEKARAVHNDLTIFTNENELHILRMEKDALFKRISALETEIGFTSGQIDDKTRTRRYRALERNLNEYIAEILSLEDRLKTKESIISRLKDIELSRRLGLDKDKDSDSASGSNWYSPRNEDQMTPSAISSSTTLVSSGNDEEHADMIRSRLNKKIEELKMKSKKFHVGADENPKNSTRIAILRKRLGELSSANHRPNSNNTEPEQTQHSSSSSHEKKYSI